jgi:hypothetical protein
VFDTPNTWAGVRKKRKEIKKKKESQVRIDCGKPKYAK